MRVLRVTLHHSDSSYFKGCTSVRVYIKIYDNKFLPAFKTGARLLGYSFAVQGHRALISLIILEQTLTVFIVLHTIFKERYYALSPNMINGLENARRVNTDRENKWQPQVEFQGPQKCNGDAIWLRLFTQNSMS